jgi:hypothetical protein
MADNQPDGWVKRLIQCICRWCSSNTRRTEALQRNRQLLDHFMVLLRDEFLYAEHPSPPEKAVINADIAKRIQQLIDDHLVQKPEPDKEDVQRRWEKAYEIERLLVFVRPLSRLAVEADRRADEAKRLGLPAADKYRAQLDTINARVTAAEAAVETAAKMVAAAAPADQARLAAAHEQAMAHAEEVAANAARDRRAILTPVLDDLQWQYQKTNLVRDAVWSSAWHLLGFGVIASSFVAIPFLCFLFERWTGRRWFSDLMSLFPNYGLYTAMSFGLLGAFFSRLTSLNFTAAGMTLEDAENRYSWASLYIRGSVGVFGALLFYFLMRTGIISGIAPDFNEFTFKRVLVSSVLTDATVLIPSKAWALLVLWSFIAGFSEKLVPDSLSKVEAQVSGKKG